MSSVAAVFFDLGDTLGTAVLAGPPERFIRFDVFPHVPVVLRSLAGRGLRLGILSNTGDIDGGAVDEVLGQAGIRDCFEARLRIYSKDVGLKKNSPEIFRFAAARAGFANAPGRCMFVGEDGAERSFAIDAGMKASPHPLLVDEALDEQPLRFIRITAPAGTAAGTFHAALRARPLVALHVEGKDAGIVYAISSQRTAVELINMRLHVELLGKPDLPLRTELYLLRDDAAVRSGFLSPQGEAARFFSAPDAAEMLLASTADGIVVALPDGRSPGEFHFADASHDHTLKLLPDPLLLEEASAESRMAAESGVTIGDALIEELLDARTKAALDELTPSIMATRIKHYSGLEPVAEIDPHPIRSRHLANRDGDNQRVLAALAREFETIGRGRLAIRRTQFSHRGITLQNIEAELAGHSPELVLITAHLDSTAGNDRGFDEAHGAAPGADDDASGVAGVLAAAERFVAMSAETPLTRTVRFVLFNAEEEGLIGSRIYARQQRSAGALIVAALQMDMIGYHKIEPRSWEIHAGFTPSVEIEARSVELARLLQRVAPMVSPNLDRAQIYGAEGDPAAGRSDHASFQNQGYPAFVATEDFFVGPLGDAPQPEANPNYHRASDTFFDAAFAADIARAVAGAAWVITRAGAPPSHPQT